MSSIAPARGIEAFREALALESIEERIADERHEIDGLIPTVAVAPTSEEAVARALQLAREHRFAVIAHGSGRFVDVGNAPASYDVALDTDELNRTIEHEPDDMTAVVDVGVSLGELQRVLGGRGQVLPVDPPCYPDATIGGILAANAYGPMRHAYGTLRDWVIGMRVAHPDGTVTKSGGRVVKNVSGYDMHKLHIGGLGTLGVITQATFKLAPLQHHTATVAFAAPSAAATCELVMRSRDRGLAVEAAEVLSRATARRVVEIDEWCALLRVVGSSAAVERTMADLRSMAASVGGAIDPSIDLSVWTRQSVRDMPPFAKPSWNDVFMWSLLALRVCVSPSRLSDALPALADAVEPLDGMLSATAGVGVIRVNVNADITDDRRTQIIDAARYIAARCDGFVLVDSAPPSIKSRLDVFGTPGSDFEVMRRLKRQFDPHGTLSPGRFLGRL